MTNKATDLIRTRKRRKEQPFPAEEMAARSSAKRDEPFEFLLSGLNMEQRTVISLRFGENLSLEEMAMTLEIPLGTVKSRLHYALETLRTIMKENQHE